MGWNCVWTTPRTRWRTYNTSGDAPSTFRRSSTASPPSFPSTAPTTPYEPEEILMTLDDLFQAKLADWRPDTGRQTLTFEDPETGWRVALTADCADQVGARAWEMTLAREQP